MLENNKGQKFDADKLRYDLLPAEFEAEVVKVLTHGAKNMHLTTGNLLKIRRSVITPRYVGILPLGVWVKRLIKNLAYYILVTLQQI